MKTRRVLVRRRTPAELSAVLVRRTSSKSDGATRRLARECRKLDPAFEAAMAEESLGRIAAQVW